MATEAPLTRTERWGALALFVRPLYIAMEVYVASAATGGYSLVGDSVSRLGQTGCTEGFCSPRHEVMNLGFVGFGVLLAGGAGLLGRRLGRWGTGLLVLSGLSSVATGLAPLDEDAALHAVAAAPLFVAQPVALIVLGLRERVARPHLARSLVATGAVTGTAAAAFAVLGSGPWPGGLERLALWPVLIGLAGYAWTLAAGRTTLGTGRRR